MLPRRAFAWTAGCAVCVALAPSCAQSRGGSATTPVASSALPAASSAFAVSTLAMPNGSISYPPLLIPDEPGGEPRPSASFSDDLPVYEIDQAIDDVTNTFSGRLTLQYTNRTGAPLSVVPLLLHPNASAELGVQGTGSLSITSVTAASGNPATASVVRPTLAEVKLRDAIAPAGRVVLAVRYQGRLRVLPPNANDMFSQAMGSMGNLTGSGAADYGLLASGDGLTTLASAYPMVAPYRSKSFDTARPTRFGDLAYNEVAHFRVRTVVPDGLSIVTNLIDQAPTPIQNHGQVVTSEGGPVRDLVMVAGRDLQRQSAMVGSTKVTSVYRSRDAQKGKVALDAAVAALGSFSRRFGAYPYPELDVVESSIVGGAGGVEFSSMVLIAGMLYQDPDQSKSPLATMFKIWGNLGAQLGEIGGDPQQPSKRPPTGKTPKSRPPATDNGVAQLVSRTLEFTVAHEVAHQWFAGIVGNDSHQFPSLDEPLAQYAAGLALEDRYGAKVAQDAMNMNVKLNYALYRLMGGPDRAVLRDTASFRSGVEYAGLVYGKAPYLYTSLRKSLGDQRLHAAIQAAVAAHRFKIASTDEWMTALEQGAGGTSSGVRAAFKHWLQEAHGDTDLAVDDSGDFVLKMLFPPEVTASLKESLQQLGLKPKDLLRMVFGGALGDDAPVGPGINPNDALRALEGLGQ